MPIVDVASIALALGGTETAGRNIQSTISAALTAALKISKRAAMSHYADNDACVAFEVWDERNGGIAGGYSVGDRVIVDTDQSPLPGDVVLAVTAAGPTFGRLYVSEEGGAATVYRVKHDNPAFGMTALPSKDHIVGVCIEHTRRLKR